MKHSNDPAKAAFLTEKRREAVGLGVIIPGPRKPAMADIPQLIEITTVVRIKTTDLDYLATHQRGFEPVHKVLSRVLAEHSKHTTS